MYRRFEQADALVLAQQMHLAFGLPTQKVQEWWASVGTEHLRVWQDGGRVVGGLIDIPMGQFFGGRRVPMHGVAGVVVDPTARGRGHGRRLMVAYLNELAQEGIALSTLYASTRALYRDVGYGLAGTRFVATLPASSFRGVGDRSDGWRPAKESDWAVLAKLYSAWMAPRTGRPDRGAYLWNRIKAYRGDANDAFVHEGPDGLDAWVVGRQTNPAGATFLTLEVVDYGARDAPALRVVAGFLGGYGTMARTITFGCGPSDPLLDLLPEHVATVKMYEPWLTRIVSVKAALLARGWPAGLNVSIDMDVVDDDLPENAGRWRLSLEDGQAQVERGGNGTIGITVQGMAGLYSGYSSPWELRQRGILQGPAESLSTLAAAFSGPAPSMPDDY